MASPKIEQLRTQFEKLPLDKKKVFIHNLSQKLAGSKNSEYRKFLNDCIMDYNYDVKNSTANATPTKKSAVGAVSAVPISKKLRDATNAIVEKTSDIAGNVKDEINASPAVADTKDRIKTWYREKKNIVKISLVAFVLGFIFALIPFSPLAIIGGLMIFASTITMIFAIFGTEKVINALILTGFVIFNIAIVIFKIGALIATFVVPFITWGFIVILIAFVSAVTKGALTLSPPPPPTPMFGVGGGELWGLRGGFKK